MKLVSAFILLSISFVPCFAQEQQDYAETFTRIKGGAVYDEKIGVDGALISETYMLTHVTCSDRSKTLRVLLPVGLDDEGAIFNSDGPESSLQKTGAGYAVTFVDSRKLVTKDTVLKPVNDQKSLYREQFEIILAIGDSLWTAMRDKRGEGALMLIGKGGRSVTLPRSKTFTAFLASCGLDGGR